MKTNLNTSENKELFSNYLESSEEKTRFQRNSAGLMNPDGSRIDLWERETYRGFLQKCLDSIVDLFQSLVSSTRTFSVKTLVDAHYIDSLAFGSISDKTMRARKTTKEAAEKLNGSFETLSQRLDVLARRAKFEKELPQNDLLREMDQFSQQWDEFDAKLQKDKTDAEYYLNRANRG